MSKQLLTRKELATRWQVSTETIKRREKDGSLPSLRLGRSVRYRMADVEILETDARLQASGKENVR